MHGAGITVVGGPVRSLTFAEPQQPAPDEVVIDVHAAGVGNWDELVRVGSWRVGGPPPMALGVEAAGTIAAVGDAVTGLAVGDAVLTHPLPLKRNGTWAEKTVAPAAAVAHKPPTVSSKPPPRCRYRRSPRCRSSTRLSTSNAASGCSSTAPAASPAACSSSLQPQEKRASSRPRASR